MSQRRCSACKLVCFKSKEHQARAWRAGHREECAALRACAPRVPPTAVRLALRCVLRCWRAQQTQQAQQQQQQQQEGQGDALARYDAILQLQHHWEALSEGGKLQFAQMGALAHRLLEAAAPEAAEASSPRELALLLARFGANSHTVSDDELRPLAVGIFPQGALVNHACQPNTVHCFVGDRMLFRAVRVIQPGEEVTTSYTELAATRWERRRELLRHHQFDIDVDADKQAAPGGDNEGAIGDSSAAASPAAASPAAAASGAAAGGSSAAALQCLPEQQPAAVLPLAGGTAELRLYSYQLPPWPQDERDAALTAVVTAPAGDAATGSSSGSSCAWGGMWGTLGLSDDTSLAATPASASFDVAADLAGDGDAAAGQQPGSAAGPSSAPGGGQPAASQVVHSWSAAGSVQQGSSQQAVQQLADAYLAALQLQQALDGMLAEGQAAAAVQRLQRSLAALAGQPSGNGSSSDGAMVGRLALGPRHVLRMRLLADLHRAAVAGEQWQTALAAAYELLPLYREVYPPVWPQLGLLWAAVAKLEHLQERPSQAIQAAEQALHILTTTHGGSGPAAEAMRQRLSASLRLGRAIAAQQRAAFHLSAAVEAGRRKEDSDSEDEANPKPFPAAEAADDGEQLWPPPIDQSQLRNPDGSIPQQPMSELVLEDTGRWDVNTFISPALAAALEAAPPLPEDKIDPCLEKLRDALEKLERGESTPGDEPASDDDLRLVAEAIDLYFLAAAPGADPDVDDFGEADLQVLEILRDTIKEVNWGVDLTEGKAQDPWKNALLSNDAKETMWRMHSQEGWTAEQLAEHFGIRQQRAMAILALKEREHAARAAGVHLHTDLAEAMEIAQGAIESMGARERHHVVLPSYPNYRELTEADADKLAALLERRLGKPFEQIEPADMTDDVVQELLVAAGMDKSALEDELAAKEEAILVEDFKRNLEYNLKKTGTILHRGSHKKHLLT
ncbi:hypothetical protein COHA_010324 [Chlorella ohadii]|uniref:SET domain-containing protein n=1 Tax=Chlorella ohadii TaxID=2649997 RepID=A0AAD5DFL8_9CHLO|nr:hypothetical protein COHA_010324 [Chlorella ohadii]